MVLLVIHSTSLMFATMSGDFTQWVRGQECLGGGYKICTA